MFYKKSVMIRLKIKAICLKKKFFEIIIKITVFLINSNDQELIHHIHCFWYTFCHHNKTIKFGWFQMFLFYDLYSAFYSLNVSIIFYSTIHTYFCYDLLLQEHFYSQLLFFCYIHYCYIPRMNTILPSSQQILRFKHVRFHLSFCQ